MLSLLLAAATQDGPTLPPIGRAVTVEDYPSAALANGLSAAALVEIAIDPDGKVTSCAAIQRFGDAALANTICPIVSRKRLRGAAFRDGTPAHSVVTTLVRLAILEKESEAIRALKQQPDATLSVSRLPDGTSSTEVNLVLVVDALGKVTDCASNRDLAEPSPEALVSAVCASRAQWQRPVRTNTAGAPVPYITTMKVGLTVAASPAR